MQRCSFLDSRLPASQGFAETGRENDRCVARIMHRVVLCIMLLCGVGFVYADDVPVIDADAGSVDGVARLERQMQYFTQLNLPQQIETLQQTIQTMQGQLDEQAHTIQSLQKQLHDFYQDLDKRVTAVRQPPSAASSPPEKVAAVSGDTEYQAYQTAFDALQQKKYDQAISLLKQYLQHYPSGKYAANAHYWLGEIYFLKGDHVQAKCEMQTVVTKFPHSSKVAAAKAKL